ncbi:hypothetical protein [Actinomadura sp. 9N407]|uniref:hypothetical protein n=1 Tax=Actinomadura sp. 9N407 TaxID=3375154 RepID=UPI0037B02F02
MAFRTFDHGHDRHLGGECGGAVLIVSELGGDRHRGFWASWPQAGAYITTHLHLPQSIALIAVLIGSAVHFVAIPA